jgi:hypothetical protein
MKTDHFNERKLAFASYFSMLLVMVETVKNEYFLTDKGASPRNPSDAETIQLRYE